MKPKPGLNRNKPVLEVQHADLERIGDSLHSRQCPACKPGVLVMARDPSMFVLIDTDNCLFCGQRFRYTDVKDGRLSIRF